MSHVQGLCQVVIDNPHADGLIVDGGWGWMIDYPVDDQPGGAEDPDRFAAHPEDKWDLGSGGAYDVEVIPELKALGPAGMVDPQHMDLYDPVTGQGRWDKTGAGGNLSQGWRVVRPAGMQADFLYWHDGGKWSSTLSKFGELTTKDEYLKALPNFVLYVFHYAPPSDLPNVGYNYLEILLGANGFGLWSLVLPGFSELKSRKYPTLGWREKDTAPWTRVMECNKPLAKFKARDIRPQLRVVSWETVDGHIILNIDGESFVYRIPELQLLQSPEVAAGPVRVIAYGSRAAFNISPLIYSMQSYAQQRDETEVDTGIFNCADANIACYNVSWGPAAPNVTTTVTVTENCQATEAQGDRIVNTYLPRVTFESSSERYRPICYLAQVDFLPNISAGTSSTYSVKDHVSARGDMNSDWRNARCQVQLEVNRAEADALVANWKGNNKATVIAGWDDGATMDLATHFTGYLAGRPMVRDGERPERVEISLDFRDGFYRIEKKRWLRLGNMTGWQIHRAFRRALNHWGIPDTKILIWNAAIGDFQTYADFTDPGPDTTPVIPLGKRKGELNYDFAADAEAIKCLNELVESVGWRWGYGRNGRWFIAPPVEYTAPHSFLIHDTTVSESGMPLHVESSVIFDATPEGRPFANNVWVEVTRGDEATAVWRRDGASHTNSAAANFIGDDWWEVQLLRDGGNPDSLVERILAERTQRQKTIRYMPRGQVDLWPDDFVKWQGSGIGAVTGSIFRNTRKGWECRTEGRYTTEFEGVFVE